MQKRENKYGFDEDKEELKPIGDKEIEGFIYHIEGDYRIFEKECKKCKIKYTTSIPEKFFHNTLPPNLHRDRILKVIKKEYCEDCDLQLENN